MIDKSWSKGDCDFFVGNLAVYVLQLSGGLDGWVDTEVVLEKGRVEFDLNVVLLKGEERKGLRKESTELTCVLDFEEIDWVVVGAEDFNVSRRNETVAENLVDLLNKLNELGLENFSEYIKFNSW